MRCNLASLLRQAREAIDPKRDDGTYAFMLGEVESHVRQVRDGTLSLEEFADFYMIRPTVEGAPCENCGKPVQVGQVVIPYDDAGEMHVDCEHPYRLTDEQGAQVLLGEPMIRLPLSGVIGVKEETKS